MAAKKGRAAESAARESVQPSAVPKELACFVAWLFPGAGHLLLGRWQRALAFAALVLLSMGTGCMLQGNLPWEWGGSPLRTLATTGTMGSGLPFFILQFAVGYEGAPEAAGYEYGSAFLITAGLMNLLLVLDVWDIAQGHKE